MDGVIFDTERMYQRALAKAVAEAGCDISDAMLLRTVGLSWPDCRRMLGEAYAHAVPVEQLIDNWLQHYDASVREGLPLKLGVLELLGALDTAQVPRGIATSAYRRDVQHNLAVHGLTHRFHVIVTHEDCRAKKPAPDPYLCAAARLKIDPTYCLAIEDSPHGVQSAFASGMMTVMVPDTVAAGKLEIERCVHIAVDLHEVREMLVCQ